MQNKYNPIIFACLIAVGIFIGQKLSNKDQVKINDKIISDEKLIIKHEIFNENYLKLSIGKKRHLKIELD